MMDLSTRHRNLRLVGFCLLAAVAWFATGYHGHDTVSEAANEDRVSAIRGLTVLHKILDPFESHPAGSAENAEVRRRLIEHLTGQGLSVKEYPFAVQGVSMTNVLAELPGDASLRPILLATHYDSVEAGPGVGDAGSCVAALIEVARWLLHQQSTNQLPERRPSVYFLFTDGEEWVRGIGHGLNGAEIFVEENADLLAQRPLILNFDARGSSGPSLLYETSRNNLKLMQSVLPHLPRPAFTASSYVAVYDLLPNATDFTQFKAADSEGLNFAFIADPHRYHTAQDTLQNLDPRSVQHHANNALAFLKMWLNDPTIDFSANQNAVFFEIAGHWIICYPESWSIWLALSLFLVQLGSLWKVKAGRPSLAAVFDTFATLFAAAIGCLMIGWLILQSKDLVPRSSHGFGPYDSLLIGGLWLSCLVIVRTAFRYLGGRTDQQTTWHVIWLANAAIGILSAISLPGFSYIFLWCGIVPAILSLTPIDRSQSTTVATLFAAVIIVPLGYQFGIALGVRMSLPLATLCFLMLGPTYPLLANESPRK